MSVAAVIGDNDVDSDLWDDVPDHRIRRSLLHDGVASSAPSVVAIAASDTTVFLERCPVCTDVHGGLAMRAQRVPLTAYQRNRPFCPRRDETILPWVLVSACARMGNYPGELGTVWRCERCKMPFRTAHTAQVEAALGPSSPPPSSPSARDIVCSPPQRNIDANGDDDDLSTAAGCSPMGPHARRMNPLLLPLSSSQRRTTAVKPD